MTIEACKKNKPDIICLPEVFNFRGKLELEKENAELINPEAIGKEEAKTLTLISRLAKENKVAFMDGSILEKNPEEERPKNTAFYVNNKGELIEKYSKIHLFDVDIENFQNESKTRSQGPITKSNTQVFSDKFKIDGAEKELRFSMAICYDLRFPEIFRSFMFNNPERIPDIIFLPSAFAKSTGEHHWEPLLRARAIENSTYIVAPNQVGRSESSFHCYGHSVVVNAWGDITAKAKDEDEEILYAEINLEEQEKVRKSLPLKNARLTEMYKQ